MTVATEEHVVFLRLTAPNAEVIDQALHDLLGRDDLGFSIVGEGDHTTMKAMGHPARIAIMDALRGEGRLSPKGFTELDPRWSLGTISYHFRHLAEAGLIEDAGTRQVRGAMEHFYSAAASR